MDEEYVDLLFAVLYTVGAAAGLGHADAQLFGLVLADTLTTLGGYEIMNHHAMTIVGIVGAWAINQPSWSRLDGTRKLLVGLSVGTIGVSIISPETLQSNVSSMSMALAVLGLQTGGYWALANN